MKQRLHNWQIYKHPFGFHMLEGVLLPSGEAFRASFWAISGKPPIEHNNLFAWTDKGRVRLIGWGPIKFK